MTRQQRRIIREAFRYIIDSLKENDHFTLRGYGTFRLVNKKSRVIRSIGTGEKITIPEYWTMSFKVSKKLKKELTLYAERRQEEKFWKAFADIEEEVNNPPP